MLKEPDKKEGTGRKLLIFNCDKLVVPKPLVATLIDIAHQPHKAKARGRFKIFGPCGIVPRWTRVAS